MEGKATLLNLLVSAQSIDGNSSLEAFIKMLLW
jgi:hypothetical protein